MYQTSDNNAPTITTNDFNGPSTNEFQVSSSYYKKAPLYQSDFDLATDPSSRQQNSANYYCASSNKNDDDLGSFQELGEIIRGKDFEDVLAPSNRLNRNKQDYFSYDNSNYEYGHIATEQTHVQSNDSNFVLSIDSGYEYQQVNHNTEIGNENENQIQRADFPNHYSNQHTYIHSDMANPRQDQTTLQPSCHNDTSNLANRDSPFPIYDQKPRPFVEIVEQPAKCALRFRYKCEGRSAGSLPGVNSTAEDKTYPSIRINNYVGRAVVVISCVTRDAPYRAHPHNIVGKEGCKRGICTIVIPENDPNSEKSFTSLGIQCVKKKDIEESLTQRESIQVDPFRNGFEHKYSTSNIDLNVVRLCFQVFIEGSTPNKSDVPLVPVVSDPIYDKKAMSDLVITKLSHCSAPATGGREIILLCDRISKDDIQVRFYEERDDKIVWQAYSEISPADVHKQVAICLKTPKYHNENITQPVTARIQLQRQSDNQCSEPRLFQFLPCESDEDIISRKRQKIEWVNTNHHALDNILQVGNSFHHYSQPQQQPIQLPVVHQMIQQPQQPMNPQQIQNNPQQLVPPYQMQQHHLNQLQPTTSQQVSPKQMIDNSNFVVRGQIIDNEGKIMQLVDMPDTGEKQQRQTHPEKRQRDGSQDHNKSFVISLDRIDTAELVPGMAFGSNIDLNLGSSLSIPNIGADTMQPQSGSNAKT